MTRLNKRQRLKVRRQRRAERLAAKAAGIPLAGSPTPGQKTSAAEPIRGRASEVIDTSLLWHMARTAPRMGDRARRALREIEVATFLPRASEVVVRRGRRVIRHTPLIIRTVFIGVRDEAHLAEVRSQPGIAEIVSHPEAEAGLAGNVQQIVRRPARLDPGDLQRFIDALAAGEIVQPVGVRVGSSVVVMTGPFASFPATVEAILPGDRLRVAVSIFGRPSAVELGMADVQAV
ncbi:Transcription termination/antitermination protein NusG [Methylobacterium hispanicum]|uniref:Transcription termination/antitermination protein NusG n=1 Tax=Methylobacterium hispanicum TaxID=270350 RepID=A0AAV4ZIA7_9HYPH|nr:Transcription termination/antitermination protein NusG [Methylobacterium hispanicum]